MLDLEKLFVMIQELEEKLRPYRLLAKKSKFFSYFAENYDHIEISSFTEASLQKIEELSMYNPEKQSCHFIFEGKIQKTMSYFSRVINKSADILLMTPNFFINNWFTNINKKLILSYPLLKDDGIMFLFVLPERFMEMKVLCDIVFGDENYITSFFVKKEVCHAHGNFIPQIEIILFYQKSSKYKIPKNRTPDQAVSEYVYEIQEGHKQKNFRVEGKCMPLFRPGDFLIQKGAPAIHKYRKISIKGKTKLGEKGKFYEQYLKPREEFHHLYKVAFDTERFCYFLSPKKSDRKNGFYFEPFNPNRKNAPYPTLLEFEREHSRQRISSSLLYFLLKFGTNRKDATIVNLFVEDCPWEETITQLNSADKGRRQFVLFTENDISEKIEREILALSGDSLLYFREK